VAAHAAAVVTVVVVDADVAAADAAVTKPLLGQSSEIKWASNDRGPFFCLIKNFYIDDNSTLPSERDSVN
jgi:hypothetical protein